MGNIFGKFFQILTWGESHGKALGVVIEGCPAGLPLSEDDIQPDLDRRRPGQSVLTSPRQESDRVEILSGVYKGITLGSPISLIIHNHDARSQDYAALEQIYRPGHADLTYAHKYGVALPPGGGRASARETAARVAAGAVAKKVLQLCAPIKIIAYVESVGAVCMPSLAECPDLESIESSPIRCPHAQTAAQMIELIEAAKLEGNSVGGTIRVRVCGVPIGLGEPVFDRLEADLAKAMMSIPATKGFEIGSGFLGTLLKGSEHNDPLTSANGKIQALSNHAGGVLGGISNGEEISFRVAFKAPSTIAKPQQTVNHDGEAVTLSASGRHDPCVLPRAVPIVEAMTALVLVDAFMAQKARQHSQ